MLRTKFLEDMKMVKTLTAEMGKAVELAVRESVHSISKKDMPLAKQVIDDDKKINEFHKRLREEIQRVIATQAPVAGDLRLLLAAESMTTELERIGDYAVRIAKRSKKLNKYELDEERGAILEMGTLAQQQVHDIMEAFMSQDDELIDQIVKRDDLLDQKYRQITSQQMNLIATEPDLAISAQAIFNVVHNLERIGDRVTNIAEDIMYLRTGKVIDLG
jgi:phosphate transport system protein